MPDKRIVLAEYFTTDTHTILFIVREDFAVPEVVTIPRPVEGLRLFVRENFGSEGSESKVRHLDLQAFQTLFAPLVEPVTRWADPGDIVWFVPHDVLHYIPLHALKVGDELLIERNPVCYSPSASVMKYCQAKRKGRRERALILAYSPEEAPLPYVEIQARLIAELLGAGTEIALGSAATKNLLRQRLAEAREEIDILHLACHGRFDSVQALRSRIVLAPEGVSQPVNSAVKALEDEKWKLTAEEIFDLEMHADLVVLSACESGVSERKPGDELIGLTRALNYAGTSSVIVSLWLVEEFSTSYLMSLFYEALKSGASKVEALQRAQVGVKNLTAERAVELCSDLKARLGEEDVEHRLLIDEDIARLRFRVHDFSGAAADYRRLLDALPAGHARMGKFRTALTQCRLAAEVGVLADYSSKIYSHPYYWSGFVLVGDWR